MKFCVEVLHATEVVVHFNIANWITVEIKLFLFLNSPRCPHNLAR